MDQKTKSLVIAGAVFIGLLMPLRLADYFWYIILLVSLGAALSVFWVFDEKPNFARFKEDWFAIVFIFMFTLSLGVFAYTMPHPFFQALLLGTTGFFVYNILQVASRIKRNYTPNLYFRNVIALASIIAIFFSISDINKWMMADTARFAQVGGVVLSFVATFLICEFLFEIQGYDRPIIYSLVISFLISQIVLVSSFWIISYPKIQESANVGVPLPAIFASVYFYFFWGISHHRLEGNLTRRILWEYTFIALLFTLVLIFTAQWLPEAI